jgi:chromosome segregation protein
MRLKKIKLAGFKSFVDPTTIPFPGEMTAVVGPNGCGKSNVIDAVRWVLGESSAKNLRGDAMTDVIFNGSTARKAVSQCSVELVFDNSSGRIAGEYANYNELSVKRIVTKEAVSSYLLNGSKCRKRDITDLFLGTGLGPRSYAIIEQGMISKLIESRPQELRVFIEEAAGISKYKERRRETENRIKHTKENLERLDDVRGELGQQLSKLQRQATAAIKYKELKASERTLKAELAVVRWLNQNELINQAEKAISAKQLELEEVNSRKRGDETSIIQFREAQENFKLEIADIQQEIFKTSTDITKIEQSQLFSKKRKQQIQMELQQLNIQAEQTRELYTETAEELLIVEDQLVDLEPNKMLMEEAVENAQVAREEAEEALIQFNEKNRDGDIQYHSLKQKLQNCHGQIQNTMSMQLRTESRIKELKQELSEIAEGNAKQHSEELQTELLLVNEALGQALQDLDLTKERQTELSHRYESAKITVDNEKSLLVGLQARRDALQSLQDKTSEHAENNNNPVFQFEAQALALSAYFQIEHGFESLFEIVFSHIGKAKVVQALKVDNIDLGFFEVKKGQSLLLEDMMTSEKAKDSLAEKVNNSLVPYFLNTISLAENLDSAILIQKELQPGYSVISECGVWLFQDMLINGAGEQVDTSLSRAAEIVSLSKDIEVQADVLTKVKNKLAADNEALESGMTLLEDAKSLSTAYSEQAFKLETQLSQLQHQITQQTMRQERLEQELVRNQLSAEEELMTLEGLNEQVEVYAQDVAELEDVMADQVTYAESLQTKVQTARAQVEQLVTQSHELALKVQQKKNNYNSLKEKQVTREEQISENKEKITILQEEAEELAMPFEEQQERLQSLLDAKEQLQSRQQEIQSALLEVEEKLLEAEKGQSGINQAAQRIQAEIDSMKLQVEGNKVRAQSYVEQLQDMQQALKPILENLPEDIDEQTWQKELEKTSASLSRLGAVNLAAVEEFESQSERKRYLDEQNDDLTQALDTLEAAIKKIDKETRTRFKATFDQINSDLKLLFPKVFGGGSAHLALTEDDMLDTGVTIMARPPGKKNSTIHLLSGGEKALTALSLVFAIFRLNPAPFCLLDEVDAPLDDANVGRFCKLVSEMSKTVQFIYITHNKVAMEMASHLTGVTMAEPGVSRMVAVDVEEALAIAE